MSFLRSSGLNVIIIIFIFLSWKITVGASEIFILKNIEINSNLELKDVRLEFDSEFSGEPLINFESDSISLRFDSVQISPKLPSLINTKHHSIIKAIRAIQIPETDIVHLDILLKSSGYKTEFPVITRSGTDIYLGLNSIYSSIPALSSTEKLTREAVERVKNDQSLSPKFSTNSTDDNLFKNAGDFLAIEDEDWTVTMLTFVVSLLFILLLIYLMAYLYNRFFSGRFSAMQGAVRIKQISSFHVGPKQKVIILEMNKRKYACGVTPSAINLIAELEDETDQSFLHVINTDLKKDEVTIDQARANFLKTRKSDSQKTKFERDKHSKEYENHESAFNDLDQTKNIFLKPNSEMLNEAGHSKDNIKHSNPVRSSFEKKYEKFENLSYGSKTVQDFAKKLSERLKFLKPIK